MTIQQFYNISSIADKYDAFLVDLWGVIHDGVEAYPGAGECLKCLRDANKIVIFLSNAPRRSAKAIEGLKRLGIESDSYNHVITSGEITYEYIKSGKHDFTKNYFMIGPERDNNLLDGTDYEMVSDPRDASFVIATGFDNDDSTIEDVLPILKKCRDYDLPLICANPDMLVVRINGKKALCAGVMARKYEEMGGKVIQFGKPYKEVYDRALSLVNTPLNKVAAIGDNLDTDIKGANNQKIDSYLIAGGILGDVLGIKHGELPDEKKLDDFCQSQGIIPKAVLPEFIWK